MQRRGRGGWIAAAVALVALFGCATGRFSDPDRSENQSQTDPAPLFPVTELGRTNCVGLDCQRVQCPGGKRTSLSGVVHDPAGAAPLFNVIVYVPNAPLAPIQHGPTCDRCGAPPSGSPLVTALTDTAGRFTLQDVPAGRGVPLVMQIGKWRRKIELPELAPCQENRITDPALMRLPRNRSEGDMPKIALATGCDPMECALRRIGIDDSEFTADWDEGAVHVYRGVEGARAYESSRAELLWQDLDRLMTYDMVVNACECRPYARSPEAIQAMRSYLDAGGRVYASHYHYNWFTEAGPALRSVAEWTPGGMCNAGPNLMDTSFPKGNAMAHWMTTIGASRRFGELPMSCAPKDVAATKPPLSQRWTYDAPTGAPSYISFNTPVNAREPEQCGRAVFADLHVADSRGSDTPGAPFPSGCNDERAASPQERVFEFLLFDVGACVQADSDTPGAPPPK